MPPHLTQKRNGGSACAALIRWPLPVYNLASSVSREPWHFWRRRWAGTRRPTHHVQQLSQRHRPPSQRQTWQPRSLASSAFRGGGTLAMFPGAGGNLASASPTALATSGNRLV